MAVRSTDRDDFDRRVDSAVLVLFASLIESLGWATAALLDQDLERAHRVIAEDQRIDDRCTQLIALIKERLADGLVALAELEDLIAILQMVPELERSADLAEHIAQRTRQDLGGHISPRSRGLIQSMCDIGTRMWQLTSRAYAERSRDLSLEIIEADDELDDLAASLVSEGALGGVEPAVAAELALVARFYERLGDHAVNLARRIATMAAPKRMSPLKTLRTRSVGTEPDGSKSESATPGLRRLWSRLTRLRLVPVDGGFFELFQAAASNGRDCADELRKMIVSFTDFDAHYQEIRTFERRGDQITIELLRRLDASFVTPYDREDIHALAQVLDDVVDDMFSVAELIHLVPVACPLPELAELADILVLMAGEMDNLIGCLRNKQGARYRLQRVEELEREGDAVHRRGVARLFSGEYEALEVLKWKDIVQSLESALNRIEDVSDVVESILVKNN